MSPELEQAIIGLLDVLRYGLGAFLALLLFVFFAKVFG